MNISIRKDVYDALRRRRAKGESFSDVLERLLQRPGQLSDFAGVWADMPAGERRSMEHARRRRRQAELRGALDRARERDR